MKKTAVLFIAFCILCFTSIFVDAIDNLEPSIPAETSSQEVPTESQPAESSIPHTSQFPVESTPESSTSEESSDISESSTEESSSQSEESSSVTSEPSEQEPSESVSEPDPSQTSTDIPEESSTLDIPDPFDVIAGVVFDPQSSIPQQSSEVIASESNIPSETTSVPASPEGMVDVPTVNEEEWLISNTPSQVDTSDMLTGIILWSVIGLAITTVLIILLTLKGNNTSSYKNRYTSSGVSQRSAYSSRKYYHNR